MTGHSRDLIPHDRQAVIDQTAHTTSSLVFVDLPNATLTTKDLGEKGNYLLLFAIIISASVANTTASFRITVDGNPLTPMGRTLVIKTNNADIGVTFTGFGDDVPAGSVLQVEWKTDKGTLTLAEFNFVVDGVEESVVL